VLGGNRPAAAGMRFLVFIELAIVLAIFIFDRYLPISKTPYLFALGWISLRLRRLGWRDVGFVRPRSWLLALGFGVLAGLGMEAVELFITQPFLTHLTGRKPDFSDFAALHGNLKLLLVGLAFAWTLAAFGEEMVWRGYPSRRESWIGTVVVASVGARNS